MAVVKAGSMSSAAEPLNTTQPAISRSIADLEQAIKPPIAICEFEATSHLAPQHSQLMPDAAFSASSRFFDLNGEVNSASKKHNSATIVVDDRQFYCQSTRMEFSVHTAATASGNLQTWQWQSPHRE
jgi:hypothetical protein